MSSNRDPLSRISVLIETEDTVEVVEDVLVNVTSDLSGGRPGITAVVGGGTCSEDEDTVGEGDKDEGVTDAVNDTGVRGGDVEE
jgi:hypothetical protein